PLQPVLRLIHCIQKERGASCALVGSLARSNADDDGGAPSPRGYAHESVLRSARVASNSAISSFYASSPRRSFRGGEEVGDNVDIATTLFRARQTVDKGAKGDNKYLFFHDVIAEYNSFLSSVIRVLVVDEISRKREGIQKEVASQSMADESKANAKASLSLLDLVASFVALKESLGMERAILSGLMADGINDVNDKYAPVGEEEAMQLSNHGARLNLIVNDLVMVVENQHRIMRDLQKLSGRNVDRPEVGGTLLRLVGESIVPSETMRSVQDQIRRDFDIDRFQQVRETSAFPIQAMTMEEFWTQITLYMDRLHSMELFLLEELENCQGSYEDLDLLALGSSRSNSSVAKPSLSASDVNNMSQEEKDALVSLLTKKFSESDVRSAPDDDDAVPPSNSPSPAPRSQSPMRRAKDGEKSILEEWEISLYDVEFHKRIGRGSSGTTYLGKYCQQDVAVKVASTSDLGLDGWTTELKSLKKLRHTNIIRFLGAIYNPTPLTYCLVLEFCDGGDLSAALAGRTPPKFFTQVASGVANGLFYLHKMNYMHRDVKPSNVLLSGDVKSGHFVAKLTDFGLAAKLQNEYVACTEENKELTAETGTYRYMAPEVIRHERYNHAADVYSFGLLMWEMLTREKPFHPKSQIEAAGSVALEGERPPFPSGVPFIVKTLIENCWAQKQEERLEVKNVIDFLEKLGNDVEAQSWLAAPLGHPVYNQQVQQCVMPTNVKQPPKKSLLWSGLFKKSKN
ncbi:hypothetical protein ACHAWF_004204, partial [Thalassiosira exigua]